MQPLESHFKQSTMIPVAQASPSTAQQSNTGGSSSLTCKYYIISNLTKKFQRGLGYDYHKIIKLKISD